MEIWEVYQNKPAVEFEEKNRRVCGLTVYYIDGYLFFVRSFISQKEMTTRMCHWRTVAHGGRKKKRRSNILLTEEELEDILVLRRPGLASLFLNSRKVRRLLLSLGTNKYINLNTLLGIPLEHCGQPVKEERQKKASFLHRPWMIEEFQINSDFLFLQLYCSCAFNPHFDTDLKSLNCDCIIAQAVSMKSLSDSVFFFISSNRDRK